MCKFLALGQEWSASGGQVGWGHVWKCFISRRVRGRAVIRAGCRPAAGDADTPILQFFPNMSSVMLLFYRDCVTWRRCRLLKSSQLLMPGQLPQVVSSPTHGAGGDTTRGGTEGFAPTRCCETWQESPAHEARSHAQPMQGIFPAFHHQEVGHGEGRDCIIVPHPPGLQLWPLGWKINALWMSLVVMLSELVIPWAALVCTDHAHIVRSPGIRFCW